ncbi:PREDICTED: uncharacterized protein LOC109354749 isoform X5 [Lupinus angustifolius]|uniref:uncharacterized protein LOC109354749 isoform X5 n=1 Tax=Lupinus angustifolius TaxID=3871 RepID=UPI00092EE3E6|nr:PREDICTED: uncharacterized protein LOC109354749 isoform X5 [Lupinus angustifolius]
MGFEDQATVQKSKRTTNPGIRIIGNRIYDSANGKTCHQCRQKTTDFAASCKNERKGKPCPIKFCQKCLFNRYEGEAQTVEPLSRWICPKCRGKCNCSCCMGKQGLKPIGRMAKKGKALGSNSVEDMALGSNSVEDMALGSNSVEDMALGSNSVEDMLDNINNVADLPMDEATSEKELAVVLSDKEKIEKVSFPTGTLLTDIMDIEFSPEDVGSVLQFLEFCRVFGKVLEVKDGEAGAILREIVHKQILHQGESSLAIQFHVRLLTMIMNDSGIRSLSLDTTNGENSWLKSLRDLISGSLVLKAFPLDWIQEGNDGYCSLDVSKKLTLLNFLCEEALGTEKLRGFLHEQNLVYCEAIKEAKSKVAAAKEKEKCLKQKLEDEMSKTDILIALSSEHEALLSQIKSEKAQAHAEFLEAKETIPKGKHSSEAMRINPVFLDDSGPKFWKLESYAAECALLLQDIKVQDDGTAAEEKWFVYDLEKQNEIEKYISLRKVRR